MPKTVVTDKHIQFAKKNYLRMAATDIDRKFGVSKGCTSRIYRRFKLIVPRSTILKFRNEKRIGKTSFTHDEDVFIKDNYLTMPVKTIAEKIGRSGVGVSGRLKAMNLVIPREIIEQRKIDSRIKPGTIPPNKGKKMSPEVYEKAKATMFQKGHRPANTQYDGHERIDADGYTLIRVKKGRYVFKHRHLWEKVHGEIPDGMVIIFKNGNKSDIRIDNLQCISLADNMRRNTIHHYPEDLKEIIYLKTSLKRQIKKKEKQNGQRDKNTA